MDTTNPDADRLNGDTGYRLPEGSLTDRVRNAVVARTNDEQPPPTREVIVRALCDRDRSDPLDPEVVGELIGKLIEQREIEETDDGQLIIERAGQEPTGA